MKRKRGVLSALTGLLFPVAALAALLCFATALEELSDMSGAKVGDKTMMDALIPASQAIAAQGQFHLPHGWQAHRRADSEQQIHENGEKQHQKQFPLTRPPVDHTFAIVVAGNLLRDTAPSGEQRQKHPRQQDEAQELQDPLGPG